SNASAPSLRKVPSIASININPARNSISSTTNAVPQQLPVITSNDYIQQKKGNRSKYGNTSMVKSFQNVEPIPIPQFQLEDTQNIEELAGRQMLPSIPRDIPFKVIDIQDKQDTSLFDSISEVFRYRASNSQGRIVPAFTRIDDKGKEGITLTWEKLAARAEKVAMVIRDKSGLQVGDCVALLYKKIETIDFIVSLLGCFLSGMVAVPINAADELSELWFILRVSKVHLILTTDDNLKTLTKNMKLRNLDFPKDLDWWPTNDFGSLYTYQIKSGKYNDIRSTPLAYIEFTKSINGELKGVAVSHQTIMSQCHSFTAATTETVIFTSEDGTTSVLPNWDTQGANTLLTYLEPRQQLGLNISVLCSIYSGSHTLFASSNIMETPAVWVYVVSKYKVTIALSGYPGIFYAAKCYHKNPKEFINYSKKTVPDLSSLRLLLIDSIIVKPDIDEYIANKLLKPLGKNMLQSPIEVVTPIISLPEHAGSIISFRDYLGPGKLEEFEQTYNQLDNTTTTRKKTTFALGRSRDVWECTLDADALRRKKVVVLAAGTSSANDSLSDEPGCIRVGSHGFPFPNSTVAIVDPESTLLCPSDTIGEVWIDGPSLPDGFWGIMGLTEAIYHAAPVLVPSETLYPEAYDKQFVRTGLLGTMIGGRLIILGSYEDCIRQQRLGNELGIEETHISTDILSTLTKKCRIDSCTLFEILINGQYLPVLAIESSHVSSTEMSKMSDYASETLLAYHRLRLFSIVVVNKGGLPRYLKDGNQYIHHLMTKRRFLAGQLAVKYLKLDVDRTVFNEATSVSYNNGSSSIWSSNLAAYELALSHNVISPRSRPQHSGIEFVKSVADERSGYDLSKFTNLVDIVLWRTSLYPEENAFVSVNQHTTKPFTWRKFNNLIATVANYLNSNKKIMLKSGTKVMILMPFGIDFVRTIYACFVLGLIPVICVPPEPIQSSQIRIQEDVNVMMRTIHDLKITHILVNPQSEELLRSKSILSAVKISTTFDGKMIGMQKLPDQINIEKATRYNKLLGPESGFSVRSEWTFDKKRPAFVMINQSTDDYRHEYICYSHDNIVAQCRSQKLICQIKFHKPLIVSGISAFEGLGLLHSAFCGVYVGCTTIVMSTAEFRNNTLSYFELISRNKCSTVSANYTVFDIAMNRNNASEQRQISLQNTQNVMLSVASRTKPRFYEKIARFLSLNRLERETINTVYSHPLNPMITTRSYMLLEPISLIADFEWLRQGIIKPLSQLDDASYGVVLHDSGIVPTNTMIAIVNPETHALCPSSVIGEIWVSSDSNIRSDMMGVFDTNKLEATIQGRDPRIKYMRTGDIGFLWDVQRKSSGVQAPVEEGQCLYVLGHLSEVVSSKGLLHFAIDIEESVENCHQDILFEGCYVIQIENEIVVIVAIKSSISPLLSSVPLIVSCILERHSLLIDTIVMVNKDQLPKKYNGEKRRRKVLAMYKRKEISAIHVSRIKNQHQAITLPQWNFAGSSQHLLDNSDNMSMISFSNRSTNNLLFDTEFNNSTNRLSVLASSKSRKSNNTE
ncbi:hypothetical protein INT48_006034, partial [Thamnidium elegans]